MGGPGSGRKKGSGTAKSASSKLYKGSSAGSRARVQASMDRGAKLKRDRIAQWKQAKKG
jgi:hypothetical protein